MDFGTPIAAHKVALLNALTLAHVGDAVHSLYVRSKLAAQDLTAYSMHRNASNYVKAAAQAQLADKLADLFTEQEKSVYLRGRNCKAHHKAKNQSGADYRKATGLEAVLGYLYLTGQTERICALLGDDL